MAESSLQERLRDHAKAFDGLLSLIPAKMYYGEESGTLLPFSIIQLLMRAVSSQDQGQKKKQTKAEAKEARRNKLDPDSELNKSVKEIMDEQARKKRKRDQGEAVSEDDWSDVEGVEYEQPGQGLKQKKKQKTTEEETEASAKERRKEEKRQGKKDRKAERKALREEEAAFERRNVKSGVNKVKLGPREARSATQTKPDEKPETQPSQSVEQDDEETTATEPADMQKNPAQHPTPPSAPASPVFDPNGTPADSTEQAPSTSTSISSTVAPSEKPKHIKIPSDTTALRARLAARITALREARKADGPDGKPIRTRQELIESRRQKQMERKAHKQELRQKAKAEEELKREEALASARNSPGSMLSPAVDVADNNFAFGRVAFEDGARLSHDLKHVLNNAKKKGPSDPKTALLKFQNEKKRLENMDEEKRKDIEEKEAWLTARKRAEGEKIRDDEKLLKKAVKRKETTKKKSEKAWAERAEGVQKSIKQRQHKREANIRERKESKMLGKAGKKKTGPKKKTGGRAGFEGAFAGGKRK
ncbi:surfeit locus protein 6 [Apiospora hydei]|uniref:Surfeit locus protein 6 n=1 Tax=Apiospora hydei TaxID=1337664 RepID=A0ABR1V5K6_9PEZI